MGTLRGRQGDGDSTTYLVLGQVPPFLVSF